MKRGKKTRPNRVLLDTCILMDRKSYEKVIKQYPEIKVSELSLIEIYKGYNRNKNTNFLSLLELGNYLIADRIEIVDMFTTLKHYLDEDHKKLLEKIYYHYKKQFDNYPNLSKVDKALLLYTLNEGIQLITKDKELENCYTIGQVVKKYLQNTNWNEKSLDRKIELDIRKKFKGVSHD